MFVLFTFALFAVTLFNHFTFSLGGSSLRFFALPLRLTPAAAQLCVESDFGRDRGADACACGEQLAKGLSWSSAAPRKPDSVAFSFRGQPLQMDVHLWV